MLNWETIEIKSEEFLKNSISGLAENVTIKRPDEKKQKDKNEGQKTSDHLNTKEVNFKNC